MDDPTLIDVLVSERHYFDHIEPIWTMLHDLGRAGVVHSYGQVADSSDAMLAMLAFRPDAPIRPTLVGGFADHRTAWRTGRPTIYVEHGAGQTYVGENCDHPSYSGGPEHEGTLVFVCPNEVVADRWRARYPDVPAVAVGCPKLDERHREYNLRGRTRPTHGLERNVAISFHPNMALCPETAGVWNEWEPHLAEIVHSLNVNGWNVLGHAHPRLWSRAAPKWAAAGAIPVQDFRVVLDQADVYVCDNSSTLPEAASIGIPLVWVWSRNWRDDAEHGGRFGDWPRGQVENISWEELTFDVQTAHLDTPRARQGRERMVERVYAHTDGKATERAVEAILAAVDRGRARATDTATATATTQKEIS